MTTGEKLAKLRREHNYTQEELADLLNVSRQSVSKWESDIAYPETEKLVKLGELFDCSMDYLLKTDSTDSAAEPLSDASNAEETRVDPEEKELSSNRKAIISAVTGSTVLVTTAVYLILGFAHDLWHPSWIIFLLIPVIPSLAEAIIKRKADRFAYPVLVTAVYLIIGFTLNLWHPGWVLFITIPVYYIIAEAITPKKKKNTKNK